MSRDCFAGSNADASVRHRPASQVGRETAATLPENGEHNMVHMFVAMPTCIQ